MVQAAGDGMPVYGSQGAVFRTSAGYTAPGQTAKTFIGKQALSAGGTTTINLYTVAAGKTFLITDIYLSADSAQQLSDVQIQAGGVPIFRAPVKGDTGPVQMPGIETQPTASSGQLVTLVWPAQGTPPNAFWMICGIEQ